METTYLCFLLWNLWYDWNGINVIWLQLYICEVILTDPFSLFSYVMNIFL